MYVKAGINRTNPRSIGLKLNFFILIFVIFYDVQLKFKHTGSRCNWVDGSKKPFEIVPIRSISRVHTNFGIFNKFIIGRVLEMGILLSDGLGWIDGKAKKAIMNNINSIVPITKKGILNPL